MPHRSKGERAALIAMGTVIFLLLVTLFTLLLVPKEAERAAVPAEPVSLTMLPPDPTAPPPPEITFLPDEARPMPKSGYRHARGEPYPLGGTVRATRPITAVTITVTCAYNNDDPPYPYQHTVHRRDGATDTVYALDSADTAEGVSLASLIRFEEFENGVHTLKLVASCEELKSVELLRVRFYVHGGEAEWEMLEADDFNDSYKAALKFFGSTERFLYRYQWVNGRYTIADPDWEEAYITTIEGLPEGEEWRVHVDAVPYVTRALTYLNTTSVRVHGTNGDSGILPLKDLIKTYNGCYVARFTSSLKTVSHHGFGTAIDLNAAMPPNANREENHAVIRDDVEKHLTCNGVLTEGDTLYYDYTYDGAYPDAHRAVPESIINYLLYEHAFYPAGFRWGFYYRSTSDAMHFTLSERVYGSHDDRNGLKPRGK